ncbi:TetR/AcrR family transcriptional regulator [Agromyces sp. LY-1074]|nr:MULTISPECIES: TetR/AcrR family transcriptional regulator [unclassified Agromyces]MDR5701047.1 TetR/AcrR family transcriptional regulator [Agromyces sp. LY-1074]MDR5707687.1 TetR/AcrR family transcriptional regulator [Agromyces sp. LY-1358]
MTVRGQAKADRREALLAAAAALFAERGYAGVTLEGLGSAAGVSGPAVYRHFPGKSAVLAAVLLDASEGLLDGGRATVAAAADDDSALRALIAFHVDFAIANADVIRVQDRDLTSLPDADAHRVRRLQREYVELWVGVLERLQPGASTAELRIRAHAAFGLINSTPHSARTHGSPPSDDAVRRILRDMAWRSLVETHAHPLLELRDEGAPPPPVE